jgi:ribosomal protein S24E
VYGSEESASIEPSYVIERHKSVTNPEPKVAAESPESPAEAPEEAPDSDEEGGDE